ncbi:Chaperone protein DnaJ [Cyphellophora attinorum]|uniref:Chaperone protein DnaJ n=1 Tax=Cyphellophora attinorum TaxID=1664694 RepID=A0A0N0NN37_9EURO|nr:Chaperone protein DnaJ [Phialophora attinorum]KPI40929.1 Chaperone protein DnaJ [Phialophora attinorum]
MSSYLAPLDKDLYTVLGVAPDASQAGIRQAYHSLAAQLHPDKNTGGNEKTARFQDVQEAYETLGDKDRRKSYDLVRSIVFLKVKTAAPARFGTVTPKQTKMIMRYTGPDTTTSTPEMPQTPFTNNSSSYDNSATHSPPDAKTPSKNPCSRRESTVEAPTTPDVATNPLISACEALKAQSTTENPDGSPSHDSNSKTTSVGSSPTAEESSALQTPPTSSESVTVRPAGDAFLLHTPPTTGNAPPTPAAPRKQSILGPSYLLVDSDDEGTPSQDVASTPTPALPRLTFFDYYVNDTEWTETTLLQSWRDKVGDTKRRHQLAIAYTKEAHQAKVAAPSGKEKRRFDKMYQAKRSTRDSWNRVRIFREAELLNHTKRAREVKSARMRIVKERQETAKKQERAEKMAAVVKDRERRENVKKQERADKLAAEAKEKEQKQALKAEERIRKAAEREALVQARKKRKTDAPISPGGTMRIQEPRLAKAAPTYCVISDSEED